MTVMIRVSEDLHKRFRKYIATRLIELDEFMSVNEALTKLLDLGENDVRKEAGLRSTFTPFVTKHNVDAVRAAKHAKADEHLKNLKLGGE